VPNAVSLAAGPAPGRPPTPGGVPRTCARFCLRPRPRNFSGRKNSVGHFVQHLCGRSQIAQPSAEKIFSARATLVPRDSVRNSSSDETGRWGLSLPVRNQQK
jgi:hypothetical protein